MMGWGNVLKQVFFCGKTTIIFYWSTQTLSRPSIRQVFCRVPQDRKQTKLSVVVSPLLRGAVRGLALRKKSIFMHRAAWSNLINGFFVAATSNYWRENCWKKLLMTRSNWWRWEANANGEEYFMVARNICSQRGATDGSGKHWQTMSSCWSIEATAVHCSLRAIYMYTDGAAAWPCLCSNLLALVYEGKTYICGLR